MKEKGKIPLKYLKILSDNNDMSTKSKRYSIKFSVGERLYRVSWRPYIVPGCRWSVEKPIKINHIKLVIRKNEVDLLYFYLNKHYTAFHVSECDLFKTKAEALSVVRKRNELEYKNNQAFV